MGQLTPSILVTVEDNMRVIQHDEYARLSSELWWSRFMTVMPTQSKRELVHFLLSTAKIQDLGLKGGEQKFHDMVSTYMEFVPRFAGDGFKMPRSEFEDLDGTGFNFANQWSRDISRYMAYWPQELLTQLIIAGETGKSYDNVAFFSGSHPYNPYNVPAGTYKNIFTGLASGSYPGAVPIDSSVTLDTALTNLSLAIAYIRTLKMPNGTTPRKLKVSGILAPPQLEQRVQQLTSAEYIAFAASSGGGSADIRGLKRIQQLGDPIIVDEFGDDPTSYYLAIEDPVTSDAGAFVYVDREPFRINYYGVLDDVQLDRINELEWHAKGRNKAGYGHPYKFFKCKKT